MSRFTTSMECRLISIWTRVSRNALAAGGGAVVVVVTPPSSALRLVLLLAALALIAKTKNSCATFGLCSTSAGKSAGESPA